MIELQTPRGLKVQVPETPAEDPSPRFHPAEVWDIQQYYQDNGYVVVQELWTPPPVSVCAPFGLPR